MRNECSWIEWKKGFSGQHDVLQHDNATHQQSTATWEGEKD